MTNTSAKSVKKYNKIIELQNRLNNKSIPQSERALITNMKTFSKLTSLKIASYNDKVGAHYNGYWLSNINGSNWALKIAKYPNIPRNFYLEIINEKIATALGLHAINSKILKISEDSNYYGIMSEDYRNKNYKVTSGKEIVMDYLYYLEDNNLLEEQFGVKEISGLDSIINVNSLPIIYQALNYHFSRFKTESYRKEKNSSTANLIYKELVRRYIYSFITMQKDFHLGNWEILENEYAAYLSPMYDLELSMEDSFYDDKNTSMRASSDINLSIDEDFKNFINSSEENKKLVSMMHYAITPYDIPSFLEKIDTQDIEIPTEIKKEVLTKFSEHFLKIENILTKQNKLTKDSM